MLDEADLAGKHGRALEGSSVVAHGSCSFQPPDKSICCNPKLATALLFRLNEDENRISKRQIVSCCFIWVSRGVSCSRRAAVEKSILPRPRRFRERGDRGRRAGAAGTPSCISSAPSRTAR